MTSNVSANGSAAAPAAPAAPAALAAPSASAMTKVKDMCDVVYTYASTNAGPAWQVAKTTVQNVWTRAQTLVSSTKRKRDDLDLFRPHNATDDRLLALGGKIYEAMMDWDMTKEEFLSKMLTVARVQVYPVALRNDLAAAVLKYYEELLNIENQEERAKELAEFSALIDVPALRNTKKQRVDSGQGSKDAVSDADMVDSGQGSKDAVSDADMELTAADMRQMGCTEMVQLMGYDLCLKAANKILAASNIAEDRAYMLHFIQYVELMRSAEIIAELGEELNARFAQRSGSHEREKKVIQLQRWWRDLQQSRVREAQIAEICNNLIAQVVENNLQPVSNYRSLPSVVTWFPHANRNAVSSDAAESDAADMECDCAYCQKCAAVYCRC